MIVPRLPERLVTIGQICTDRFQIAGLAHRPERHFTKGFAHVDYSNARTVMRILYCKLLVVQRKGDKTGR